MRRQDQVSRHWLRLTILLSVRLSNDFGLAEEGWLMPDRYYNRKFGRVICSIYLLNRFRDQVCRSERV